MEGAINGGREETITLLEWGRRRVIGKVAFHCIVRGHEQADDPA
jgi:hypothetical protein